jgi:phosphopantetheine adenylyltransferase
MSNRWVEHVRKFAKDNDMTYMCAITEASKTYKKTKDDELKSTPKMTTKAIPKEQDDKKHIRLIEEYLERYGNSNLKKQITGNTFDDRKQKALVIVEELNKDANEINRLKNKMMSDDTIDLMDFVKNNNASLSKFLKRKPQSVANYINKLVQQKKK